MNSGDVYQVADVFLRRLAEFWPERLAVEAQLTKDEVVRILSGPICEHGKPRIVDCQPCRMRATLAAQCQRIVFVKTGDTLSDELAWKMASDWLSDEVGR